MSFCARVLGVVKKPSGLPISQLSLTVPTTNPVEWAAQTLTATVTGGVAPYRYIFKNSNSYVLLDTTSASNTQTYSWTAEAGVSGLWVEVIDAAGQTMTSSTIAVNVRYLTSVYASKEGGAVGQTMVLRCTASANPAASFVWFYMDMANVAGGWIQFTTGDVYTTGVWAAGWSYRYYCAVTNSVGTVDSNILVHST